jgi:hypothetical protein
MSGINEPDLAISPDFGTTRLVGGNRAMAMRIQNLLMHERGSHPDDVNMGIGLGLLRMELIDPQATSDISSEIQRQIATYLPDVPLAGVTVTRGSMPGMVQSNQESKRMNILVRMNQKIGESDFLIFSISGGEGGAQPTMEVFG